MLYIDAKYATILGSRLRNFRQVKPYNWNFSCPICGDSSTKANKARGYILTFKQGLIYKCHNCQLSCNFGNFLKRVDSNLYDEYVLERYKAGASKYTDHKDPAPILPKETKVVPVEWEDEVLAPLKRLDKLDPTHPAVQYLIKRKIPLRFWSKLYFAPKFKAFVNSIEPKFQEPIVDEHPRFIIPFFNAHGKCFAFQGRAYGDEQPKYYTIKVGEDVEKIYGLDRVDYSKRIYVVEGPIDSMFLPNALAVSGSSFDTPMIRQILTNATIVMDNEPRNKDIAKQLAKYIDLGYNVCMYPDSVVEKDINDMVLNGKTEDEILDLINTNTFSGMEAKLRFSEWKKC
jgi:transcription elongation factor Elf1